MTGSPARALDATPPLREGGLRRRRLDRLARFSTAGALLWLLAALIAGEAVGAAVLVSGSAALALAGLRIGAQGRWLRQLRAAVWRRRWALLWAGLVQGQTSLAGDLYEEAGFARRAIEAMGAAPPTGALWFWVGRRVGSLAAHLPVVGETLARVAGARGRMIATRLAGARSSGV